MKAKIQFVKGFNEKVSPKVRLTRSLDNTTGTATFKFKDPSILDKYAVKEGEVTGMYLIDEEGVLETRNVTVMHLKGKPRGIRAIYIMKNSEDWNRFMRFMERYGKSHGLAFTKAR